MNTNYFAALILVLGCGGYEDCNDTNSCQQPVTPETKTVETKKEATSLQDELVPQWALKDISFERLMCGDDYADYVEKPQEFCQCLVEKIAIRWTRENYIRYQYSYTKRLASNGSMKRCAVPTDYFSEPETTEDVKEDQEFNPLEAEDDGKTLEESIKEAVKETGKK